MLVEPVVIIGAKEFDCEFARFVIDVSDVVWNVFWVADFGRPPAIVADLGFIVSCVNNAQFYTFAQTISL